MEALVDFVIALGKRWWVLVIAFALSAIPVLEFFTDNSIDVPLEVRWTALALALLIASYLAYREVWLEANRDRHTMLRRLRNEGHRFTQILAYFIDQTKDAPETEALTKAEAGAVNSIRESMIDPWIESVRSEMTENEWRVFDAPTSTDLLAGMELDEIEDSGTLRHFMVERVNRLDVILDSA